MKGKKMIKRYKQTEIEKIVQILKNDGIISIPTDTVYGICARINSKVAHDKLIKAKERPINKSFPVMCENEEQIKSIAIADQKAEKLIKTFMPGPITIVLRKKEELPNYITNGKDTIAIRMATSKTIEEIINKLGSPIFMTSANQSGKKECTNLEEIEKNCPLLDGIIEGTVIFSKGSTIVDCSSDKIKILREGPISKEQIKNALKKK
jgi:L-threonylcarbamoyladenylate synthase